MSPDPRFSRRTALLAAAALAATTSGCDAPPETPKPSKPEGVRAVPAPSVTSPPAPPALPAEVVNGPRDRPNVALTFHGQGDLALARELLTAVEGAGARVTVLAVGSWLRTAPAMAGRILSGGHELGNHTERHLDIGAMSAAGAYTEINECATVLRDLTGSPGRWFRPSQTRFSTPTVRAQATRVGYRTCLSYDVDSLDHTDPGPDAIVRTTLDAVRPGSIVSLHFGHAGTVQALPGLITGLRARGLTPVTVSDLLHVTGAP